MKHGYLARHNLKNGKDGRFVRKRKGRKRKIAGAFGAGIAAGTATESVRAVGRSAGLPANEALGGGFKIVTSQVVHRAGRIIDRLLPR